jgi:integrase
MTTALVPYRTQQQIEPVAIVESVNLNAALVGLSPHTQRAYTRWIRRYLAEIHRVDVRTLPASRLPVDLILASLRPAHLKVWLGILKSSPIRPLGRQSLGQAKAAIVFLAQAMAELGRVEYTAPAALSRVKVPHAEAGQRQGTWLTPEEIRSLIRAIPVVEAHNPPLVARDTAIIVLMVATGLRRDEIVKIRWSDLTRQGDHNVLRTHGKGAKLRVVKLPAMVVRAIKDWKRFHPTPEGNRAVFLRVWKGGNMWQVLPDDHLSDRAIWCILKRITKAAGLTDVSPHDLRRSFARGAYEAGAPMELIRQALGHSNTQTTEHYINAKQEFNWAATDSFASTIETDDPDLSAFEDVMVLIDSLSAQQRRQLLTAINSRYAGGELRIAQ